MLKTFAIALAVATLTGAAPSLAARFHIVVVHGARTIHHPIARLHRTSLHRRRLRAHMSQDGALASAGAEVDHAPAPHMDAESSDAFHGRTVHYDHGPQGLNDDVGAVGVVRKF
jgi:hypothetical protein